MVKLQIVALFLVLALSPTGCDWDNRIDGEFTLQAPSSDPLPDIDTPYFFADDFGRSNSTNMGGEWSEELDAGPNSDYAIQSNQTEFTLGVASGSSQITLWHTVSVESINQWGCIEFISASAVDLPVSIAFRGSNSFPTDSFYGVTLHPDGHPQERNVLFERFSGTSYVEPAGATITNLYADGLSLGDWLCASIAGTGAATEVSIWKFSSDPGDDPSLFPAPDGSWIGSPLGTEDLSGHFIGFSVWNGTTPPGSMAVLDNFKGGAID